MPFTPLPQPVTRAQQERYERILACAERMLRSGEDGLQMKDLPDAAGVSLATLYRYFPSRQHLILAIAINRMRRALDRVEPGSIAGETPRERVAGFLLRGFEADQHDQPLSAAVHRAAAETGPEYQDQILQLAKFYLANLRAAANPLRRHQIQVLPLILHISNAATAAWLAGTKSATEVRFEILLACRLLDVSAPRIAEDQADAARQAVAH